jgi:O-antigen/teichoic acid export membrane protein
MSDSTGVRARGEIGAAARSAPAFVLYETVMRFKGLILVPVLTRALPLESYGLYVQAMVVMGLGAALAGFHLHHTLVRFLPGAATVRERSGVLTECLAATAAASLVLVPPLCLLAATVNPGLRAVLVPLALLIVAESWLQLATGFYIASERVALNLIANTLVVLCDLIVVTSAAVMEAGLSRMLLGMIAVRAAALVVLGPGLLGGFSVRAISPARLARLLRFASSLVLGAVAAWIVDSSDRIVIGVMLGNALVGAYNPAYIFGSLLLVVPRLAGTLLPPMAARLHDRGEEEVIRLILQRYWRGLLLLSLPFIAATLVLQDVVLGALATPEVAVAARWVAPIVALGTLFYAAAAIFGEVMKLKLRPGATARAWMLAAAVNVALNLILVPRLGLIAAAITTASSFGVAFVLVYRASARLMPISLEPWTALRCALSCAPLLVAFAVLRPTGLVSSLTLAGAGAGAYALLVFGMDLIRGEHLLQIWSAVQPTRPAAETR